MCVRDLLAAPHTVLPCTENPTSDLYVEDEHYRAEEPRQLARHRTLHSQQDQHERHAEHHAEVLYDLGNKVVIWTPAWLRKQSEKLLKTFSGPCVAVCHIASTKYEVPPVLPAHPLIVVQWRNTSCTIHLRLGHHRQIVFFFRMGVLKGRGRREETPFCCTVSPLFGSFSRPLSWLLYKPIKYSWPILPSVYQYWQIMLSPRM